MILGTGIDMIEIYRIARAINKQSFVERVFTCRERNYCDSRGVQRTASYAARFAAKEAVLKAFGTGLTGGTLQDITVVNDEKGRPGVELTGFYASLAEKMGVAEIYLSLTHTREYAAAQVILWGGRKREGCNSGGNAAN